MGDLGRERRAVADAIHAAGAQPIWFEAFGGRDDDAQAAYLAEVATSGIFLGILSRTYGRILPSRLSPTHEEYREAERLGLRISVWVNAKEDFQGNQGPFVEEIRLFHTPGRYTDPADLAQGVTVRLREIAAEELSPWVKLGDAIFRAHTVNDDGRVVTVSASVHNSEVVDVLERLRPTGWAGKRSTRLTYSGRSLAVRVVGVSSRTAASRRTGIEVTLERAPEEEPNGISMSFSLDKVTYSGDDMTEIGLRRSLFGESAPSGLLSLGGFSGDPLADLPADGLPVELQRATIGLLITEALVGSRRASRVNSLRVSPPGPNGRRLVLNWTGRSAFGRPTEKREVDGYLAR